MAYTFPKISQRAEAPAPGGRSAASGAAELTPGRVVRATVLQTFPGRQVLVRLPGGEVMAQSRVDLTAGQTLDLMVERTSPQVVLSPAPEQSAPPPSAPLQRSLSTLLAARTSLPAALETILGFDPTPEAALLPRAGALTRQLQQALAQALRPAPDLPPEEAARRLVAWGAAGPPPAPGAPRAKKSPRELLAQLSQELQESGGRLGRGEASHAARWHGLAEAVRQMGDFLEAQSRLHAQLWSRDGALLLALPLALGPHFSQGELWLGLGEGAAEGEAGAEEETTRLRFFLAMSALGPVLIEALMTPRQVAAEFRLSQPEAAALVQSLLPELGERLNRAGFACRLAAVCLDRATLTAEAPLERMVRLDGGRLSLRV
ncbi:MAG: flagellar hook-length control protein FliK [Deltaproteobacteria bacterium]|nr:flagellar hook-length control protein FliK [Deltaproteobacteria bacterium]